MLANLFVSDLALIRRLSVDFHKGFSVFTGETGAGKSLVLDALGLILKQKGAKELIREGAEKMEVSLFFDSLSPETMEALGDDFSSEELKEGIVLSRTVTRDGKSVCRMGGRTVPFSRLSAVAAELLSIQGQDAAGGLFDEKNHRRYLDSALDEKGLAILEEYRALYSAWSSLRGELSSLASMQGDEKEKVALYDYQMKEIAKVKPRAGEEEALEAKLRELKSQEKLHGALYTADRALNGGEKGRGALFLLEAAAGKLEGLGEEDPQFPLSTELYELAARAKEIARDVSFRLSGIGEDDPAELMDRIQRRLDLLYRLKLKYGSTVEEVLSYYEELKRKKDLTLSLKDDIKRKSAELEKLEGALKEKAALLTAERKRVARELEEGIHSVLAFLDMPKTRFFVTITPTAYGQEGADFVTFSLAANTGEGVKPLSQVASGGEGSRIMLALQLKLGKAKDADTMVFDEVDTGISGATAQKIGIALKTLSLKKQILCVTHSAQVSTLANQHYLVEKKEAEGRTESTVIPLDEEGLLMENARLFAGATLTQEARTAAEQLRREGTLEFEKWKDNVL